MRFLPESVDALAQMIIQKSIWLRQIWDRRFASHFVVMQDVVSKLWGLLEDQGLPHGFQPMHLLWTLCFLKIYVSENVVSNLCDCHEDTLHK